MVKSIGKSIEDSLSKELKTGSDQIISQSVAESLENTNEKSSGVIISDKKELSHSNLLTHSTEDTNAVGIELSVSKSIKDEITNTGSIGGLMNLFSILK